MKLTMRTRSKEGKHPLCFKMRMEGKVYWFNVGISVDVKEWAEASQSDRKMANYLNKKGISKKIALLDESIADMRRHHRLTKANLEASIENIMLMEKREELKRAEELKRDFEEKKKHNIKNFLIEHFRRIESGEARTSKKEKYAKYSVKNWGQFKRVFLDFYQIRPFEWEDINEALVDRYISYLESVGYMKYTIEKHISLFRTFIGVAERQGLHSNTIASRVMKSPQIKEEDKGKKIYLTKEELDALYEMTLEGFYEQVRDVFLIGCFTGLRFSDYARIEDSNIGVTSKGTRVIRMTQGKTGGKVVIPIMDERLEALLRKYDYNVPTLWGQSLNRAIKEICKELSEKIPTLQKKERTILTLKERRAEAAAKKKGKTLYEYDEKGYPLKARYDLVASHTCRRTCVTNMYLSGKFTVPQMMSISGHKTEAMFYRYVKLSFDEKADEVASAACDGLF